MPLFTFSDAYLPYCLKRQPDGRYAVLNREHKPLGVQESRGKVNYADYPALVDLEGLTPEIAESVSWNESADLDCIYLYEPDDNPKFGYDEMELYAVRLHHLAALRIHKPDHRE